MTLDDYYDWAREDAARRGLPALQPVIEALRASARQLRDAPWNDDAAGAAVTTSPLASSSEAAGSAPVSPDSSGQTPPRASS